MPGLHALREKFCIALEVERLPRQRADRVLQRGPGFNLIEKLEQQDAEEQILVITREVVAIDDISYQVLTDPVRRAIRVRKLEVSEHRIVGERAHGAVQPAIEDALTFSRKTPIRIEHRRHAYLRAADRDGFARACRLGLLPMAEIEGWVGECGVRHAGGESFWSFDFVAYLTARLSERMALTGQIRLYP